MVTNWDDLPSRFAVEISGDSFWMVGKGAGNKFRINEVQLIGTLSLPGNCYLDTAQGKTPGSGACDNCGLHQL